MPPKQLQQGHRSRSPRSVVTVPNQALTTLQGPLSARTEGFVHSWGLEMAVFSMPGKNRFPVCKNDKAPCPVGQRALWSVRARAPYRPGFCLS